MPGPWPIASHDSDFDPYLAGRPEASVRMFRRFVDMARASGPVIFELQNGPVVLRGTRRIFGGVRVLDHGLEGRLNLMRRVDDPRLVKVEANAKTLVSYRYLLTSIADLDGEFQRWLDEAHAVGDGAHLPRQPDRPVKLRQATEADLPSIQRVITAAYSTYLSRMGKPPAPLLRDYGPAIRTGAIWVTGNPVVGLIVLTQVDDVILIENVAVHPDQQGSGLGRLLMEFAERQARKRGIQRLALYTNEVMTENQALYAHLGYRVTGRRAEDGYHRIYMEKILPASPPL